MRRPSLAPLVLLLANSALSSASPRFIFPPEDVTVSNHDSHNNPVWFVGESYEVQWETTAETADRQKKKLELYHLNEPHGDWKAVTSFDVIIDAWTYRWSLDSLVDGVYCLKLDEAWSSNFNITNPPSDLRVRQDIEGTPTPEPDPFDSNDTTISTPEPTPEPTPERTPSTSETSSTEYPPPETETTSSSGPADSTGTPLSQTPKSSDGLSTGAVVGISVGATIGGLIVLGISAFFAWRHWKRQKKLKAETHPEAQNATPGEGGAAGAPGGTWEKAELPESTVTSPSPGVVGGKTELADTPVSPHSAADGKTELSGIPAVSQPAELGHDYAHGRPGVHELESNPPNRLHEAPS